VSGCGLCPDGGTPPAELVGPALDLGGWAAGVLRGFEVPGWLAVFPRRHVDAVDALSDLEADGLGGALRRVTAAVRAATGCEKVYAVSFGERLPHFHVLLMAVPADLPAELRGAALIGGRDRLRDPTAAREVAERLRP
jgi:galactose-1-phosphate uridylyltransferase